MTPLTWLALGIVSLICGVPILAVLRRQANDRKTAREEAAMNRETDSPAISDRWLDAQFRKKEGE